ncbi:MAG: acyl-CoA synthetase FdrA [Armatimonadota bacterium]|nr:acyl-CoA synthetase FdrA [Armatimonadota bacterium]MDR7505395.1 acyl-CoA synthetase FdrA [Armatimonadota bacterium]MDR7547675.1 acyl-CoA synthetase FdrA [Armatimonadota bacterium]
MGQGNGGLRWNTHNDAAGAGIRGEEVLRSRIKTSAYFDSVTLMLVQREIRTLPGVREAGVVMGTDANKELLREAGLLAPEVAASARPDDLIVAVEAEDEASAEAALSRADEALAQRRATPTAGAYRPKTVATAARTLAGANLALISVPGRFAAGVAREALAAGLHAMLFSDNVPVEAEVELKRTAASRGLLVMGPDCGTAILGGAALGFANGVRRGPIGIVGAAGTGIQEVSTLIHRGGSGVSHAVGTGGRDLSAAVGGATALWALAALAADPDTDVIVFISKPPAARVASTLLAAAQATGKPVVVNFIGAAVPSSGRLFGAATLEDAAETAVRLATGSAPSWPRRRALPAQEALRLARGQRYIRGLYSGGTLCYEALAVLERHIGPVYSNTPLRPDRLLSSALQSREHTVIDMGSDEFTVGRLHPMLDPELRQQRLLREAADPEVAVILMDVVLGWGAHPDPAGQFAPVIRRAREAARSAGRWLPIIVSVTGTDLDPQSYDDQVQALIDAGALVPSSHVEGVRLAALIAEAAGSRGEPCAPTAVPPAAEAVTLPNAAGIIPLLAHPPKVVNVGLELFADSLRAQGVDVVSVDWQPPAGGRQRLLEMLDKLGA